MKAGCFLFLSMIICCCFLTGETIAQTPDTPIIEVGGYLWNKTTLSVLISSNNQSEWSAGLVNSTLRAIENWNHAISAFSTNYSDFNYLSAVNLQVEVSNQTEPNFDIYVNFSETVTTSNQDAIGTTTTVPYSNGTIQNCIINLATQSRYVTLTQKDIQSVATHEFGHALGIGHCDSSNDLMYPLFDVYGSQYEVSTLDMFGVANAFQWIINPDQPVPSIKQELSLPDNIAYEYIALAQPAPQAITDNPIIKALEILSNILFTPYILLMIAVGVLLLILIELFFRRTRKSEKQKKP